MFALFYSLYLAMLTGSWTNYSFDTIVNSSAMKSAFDSLGRLITNIFNNAGNYETLGRDLYSSIPSLVSFVLALITSIGIVVMAVKGIKKVFGIFFMGIR